MLFVRSVVCPSVPLFRVRSLNHGRQLPLVEAVVVGRGGSSKLDSNDDRILDVGQAFPVG